jgi:N-acetylglucosaminyldiphosphoundecaprenol N-acetyl-beta-D-mannosaminyltransferase
VARINAARPDIVWVGLSTPKQERWMAAHVGRLDAPALVGVGAAFDFHAGIKRQAPRWMQRSGLEWSFRLLTEPRRLGRRYLVNNPLFVYKIALQLAGRRGFGGA